jgi:hypothetical protein
MTKDDKNKSVEGSVKKPKEKTGSVLFEDIVITFAVAIGIIGGGIMSLLVKAPPIIVSIFLSMGISSLVYRFLGGIKQGSSITLKGIKLTGTVAVWIGCALLINAELTKQLRPVTPKGKNLVLEVRKGERLAHNIEVVIAEDDTIVKPAVNENGEVVDGKFIIPIEKLKTRGLIFITEKSDTDRYKEKMIEYIHRTEPILTVHIEDE